MKWLVIGVAGVLFATYWWYQFTDPNEVLSVAEVGKLALADLRVVLGW